MMRCLHAWFRKNNQSNPLPKALLLTMVVMLNLDGVLQCQLVDKIAAVLFLAIVVSSKIGFLLHLALLLWLLSFADLYLPQSVFSLPVIALLVPLILSTLMVLPFSRFRAMLEWIRMGRIDLTSTLLLIGTSLLSVAALIAWGLQTDHLGRGMQVVQKLSAYPEWLLLYCGIPLFAIFNAAAEEAIYRGVLQTALARVFEQSSSILTLQTSAFAAIHFAMGFPNGFLGYLMVFVYGLMLGYLRIRTNGMLAPYLAHLCADLTIGYFLYFYLLPITQTF